MIHVTKRLPEPPVAFPDGEPFPGAEHLRSMESILRWANAREDSGCEYVERLAVLVACLIRSPESVEVTPRLLRRLSSGRQWLSEHQLTELCEQYGRVLDDLSRYWSQLRG